MGECKTQKKHPFRSRLKPETTRWQQAKIYNPVKGTKKNTAQKVRRVPTQQLWRENEGTEAETTRGAVFTAAKETVLTSVGGRTVYTVLDTRTLHPPEVPNS